MLALSPPLFSTIGWPLEDPIGHDQEVYNILRENKPIISESYSSFGHSAPPPLSPFPQFQADFDPVTPSTTPISCDPTMARKINHNASERDRRKKINSLYSTLRSLLPAADQPKKLSIPATVSRVLKYIPELQQEVAKLIQQKEELLSRVNSRQEAYHQQTKRRSSKLLHQNHVVSASKLSEEDFVIHIVTTSNNNNKVPPGAALSEVLINLEKHRIPLVNASTFEPFEGKVFHSLHVKVEREWGLECEALTEMVLNMYDDKPQPGQGVPSSTSTLWPRLDVHHNAWKGEANNTLKQVQSPTP